MVPRHERAVVLQPAVRDLREPQPVCLRTVLELLQRRRARRVPLAVEPRLRVLRVEMAARLRNGGRRKQLPRQEPAAGRSDDVSGGERGAVRWGMLTLGRCMHRI